MTLEDATKFAVPGVPENRGAEWIHHFIGSSTIRGLSATTAVGQSIPAYANQGRWVVNCPDCSGAQLACRTDPRFLCNYCGNATIGGLWRGVDWPAEIPDIEDALAARPEVNQNCGPAETVQDLLDENAVHVEDSP